MAKSYYGYAERNSDSQVNWAEIGKNMSDMLTETNRVREEKKDAIEKATREEFKRIADSPIGEHESARIAAIKLSDTAANQLRINNNLMKNGRMSVKDYTIFHQNISDNIDLAFNANKAYQENYAEISKRAANGDASALELLNAAQAEKFGDWSKMGWVISPNGTIMAGLKTKKEVGGKEVEVIDDTPGNLASMQSLNGLLLTRIDKYKYEPLIDNFVNGLGEEITTELNKGTLTSQGDIITIEDITSREYLKPGTKEVLSRFLDAENAKIKEIAGTDLDKARILLDSKRITNSNMPYGVTNDPSEADRDPSKILRIYDQVSGGYTYKISKEQDGEITKFLRDQMRAKYDRKVKKEVVSQTQLQETEADKLKARKQYETPDETTKPTEVGEILALTTTNSDGSKEQIGVTQRIENLVFPEGKGIQNVATGISYNSSNGTLELSGYQISGREDEGKTVETENGAVKGRTSTTVVKKKNFVKNDLNNAPLLSTMILKIPNPERPGYNFSSIKEAKSYYKRKFESQTGNKELD
jgi:hypothetical protein